MNAIIDYYFATISPYEYLGHDRFTAIAEKAWARVAVKPINLGEVFRVFGGLPLSKRAPQRQAYRLTELSRWSQYLNKPMRIQPKFFPVNGDLAAHWILAAGELGGTRGLDLAGAVGRAIWEAGSAISPMPPRCRQSLPSAASRPTWTRECKPRISRRNMPRSRRRRSPWACSAPRPTSSPANCSGDRIDSTSSTAKWQNSVFSTAGAFRARFESWAGRFLRGDRFAASCTSGRESRNA